MEINTNIKKLALAGTLIALGVALSPFSIPVGAAKCFPIQHVINIIAGVILGPLYAVSMGFVTALIRNIIGTGSLLAFPGSMCGALAAGLAAKYLFRNKVRILPACIAELIGTGVIGAIAAYPIATSLMGRDVALYTYIVPFAVSSAGGAVIAMVLLTALVKTKVVSLNTSKG